MTSQHGVSDSERHPSDGFVNRSTVALAEIIPNEQATGAGVRTRTVDIGDNNIIHYADRDSNYRVVVRRLLAMDGLESEPAAGSVGQRMSLIILDYDLTSIKHFKVVNTELVVNDDPQTVQSNLAKPQIVAWGPFHTETHWNPSEAEIEKIRAIGFELGVSYAVSAKIAPNISNKVTKKKQYFNRGIAQKIYSDEGGPDSRLHGIKWTLQENPSIEAGIPPNFRVALLLKRQSDAQIKISYKFNCEIGSIHDVAGWFGFHPDLSRKALITYIASEQSRAFEEGEELLAKLKSKQKSLGDLRSTERLAGLTPVWGLEPLIKATSV